MTAPHQYITRGERAVVTEPLFGDRVVNFLYSRLRERAPWMFRALTSARMSQLLAVMNFDLPLAPRLLGNRGFLKRCGVDLAECVDPPESFKTPRHIFERRIRYWSCRPMSEDAAAVVSPADARALVGSLHEDSLLFIKDKFFTMTELLGEDKPHWREAFRDGDFAIFRLTPDKYHYNHTPVAGVVTDIYALDGDYHSCNPGAVARVATPYSKNKRVVAIIDTDAPGGTGVGLVAMIEVVALMIGGVIQRYSERRYDDPREVRPGMFLVKGAPKSVYQPGSSTNVLLFQKNRVRFAEDLVANLSRGEAHSRFTLAFGQPLVETDVAVRSLIAYRNAWPSYFREERNP